MSDRQNLLLVVGAAVVVVLGLIVFFATGFVQVEVALPPAAAEQPR